MKNSYILLRNNKESNALSIEQLQKIGLKKTDLIWVECQSMNWRSPFEIAELKNLVPEGNDEDKTNTSKKLIAQEVTNSREPLKKQGAGKTWNHLYIKHLEKYSHPEHVILPGLENKEIDLQANKSSSGREINATHVTKQAQRKQQDKIHFGIRVREQVKKIALYTVLILTGALLMLMIETWVSKRSVEQQTKALPEKSVSSISAVPKVPNDTSALGAANTTETVLFTEKSSSTKMKERKKYFTAKNNIPLKTVAAAESGDSNNSAKISGTLTEVKAKPATIEDISSKIALEANHYNVNVLGGIRNLAMTLKNGSGYMLDKVTVELKYLNPDGHVVKREHLYFQNVRPQDAATLKVDKSKRGVKVEYQVTNIECKALTNSQIVLPGADNYSTN